MDGLEPEGRASRAFVVGRRRPVTISEDQMVSEEPLRTGQPLPLVVRPAVAHVNLASWTAAHRAEVEEKLHRHGAILFRGFDIHDVDTFRAAASAMSREMMTYRERTSPRTLVAEQIYTSTDYPADQRIFPHNEHSYALTFPMKLFFWCESPALEGGETPIGDTRRVLARIPEPVRQRFIEHGWMYVRNFGDGFGLPWQTVFQTDDPAVVEEYCRRAAIEVEWKPRGKLRTRQVRPVIASHPVTGVPAWFNHATFFHVTTLDPDTRSSLLAEYTEQDLPNQTYYGDGSSISEDVMEQLRDAYRQEMVTFPWQRGDLLLIDNMLTSHARASFTGARRVLVAMADPYTRPDQPAPAGAVAEHA